MKKRILVLCLILLVVLPGCADKRGNESPETNPSQQTQSPSTSVDPSVETGSPTDVTEPTTPVKPEYSETYHSGKPYTPWGTPQTFTLTLGNGKKITFTGNVPEVGEGVTRTPWLWWNSTKDMNTAYMLAYIDGDQYSVKGPDSLFEDMGDAFIKEFYIQFSLTAKNAQIDIRGNEPVRKHGFSMNRVVGAAQWTYKNVPKAYSFVSYVFQVPDGGYLCILFQCEKKGWAATQEAAENFVNTFSWGDGNGVS